MGIEDRQHYWLSQSNTPKIKEKNPTNSPQQHIANHKLSYSRQEASLHTEEQKTTVRPTCHKVKHPQVLQKHPKQDQQTKQLGYTSTIEHNNTGNMTRNSKQVIDTKRNSYYGTSLQAQKDRDEKIRALMLILIGLISIAGSLGALTLTVNNHIIANKILERMSEIENSNVKIQLYLDKIVTDNVNVVIPKINLIDNAVSLTIPSNENLRANKIGSQINELYSLLVTKCEYKPPDIKFHECNISCTNQEILPKKNIKSQLYSDISVIPHQYCALKDQANITEVYKDDVLRLENLAEGDCVVMSSLTVYSSRFSYYYAVGKGGCINTPRYLMRFVHGSLSDVNPGKPTMIPTVDYYPKNPNLYTNCVPITTEVTSYFVCTLANSTNPLETNNVLNTYISIVVISPQHRPTETTILVNDCNMDLIYTQVITNGQGGILQGNTLYVPGVGLLSQDIVEDPFCYTEDCEDETSSYRDIKNTCLHNLKKERAQNKQLIDVTITVNIIDINNPVITIITQNLTNAQLGSKSRYYNSGRMPYAYKSAMSWFTYPLYGKITSWRPTSFNWSYSSSISRPGSYPCTWGNRCPHNCWSGVYNDIFIIDTQKGSFVTVYLKSDQHAENPYIALIHNDEILYETKYPFKNSGAKDTTTSCYVFKNEIWCTALVEVEIYSQSTVQPDIIHFKIPPLCSKAIPQPVIRSNTVRVKLIGRKTLGGRNITFQYQGYRVIKNETKEHTTNIVSLGSAINTITPIYENDTSSYNSTGDV